MLLAAADTFRAGAIEQLAISGPTAWELSAHPSSGRGRPFRRPLRCAVGGAVAGRLAPSRRYRGAASHEAQPDGRAREDAPRRRSRGPGAPHETLLVLDATTGANGLAQARKFVEAAGVTGVVLTKLDGSAQGGVVLAIYRELQLPVRYVGVGEGMDDLIPFDPSRLRPRAPRRR